MRTTSHSSDVRTGLGLLSIVSLLAGVFAVAGLAAGRVAVEALPELPEPPVEIDEIDSLDEAIDKRISTPSVVKAADGSVIGRFRSDELHRRISVGEVPDQLETVLLTAEDRSFRSHGGFDPAALLRASLANLTGGRVQEGGSTLTQQLAKNLFTSGEQTISRKLEELRVAIEIEDRFSKDEILTAYVNSAFLGGGAFGFEAASETYFRKSVDELTLSETALLVGILPAPSEYDPRERPEAAEAQRLRVLDQLADQSAFDETAIESARAERPEVLAPSPTVEKFPYYLDYVRRHLLAETNLDENDIFGAGLTIETALDPDLQDTAIYTLRATLDDPDGPEGAIVVVDPASGHVRALVGGRDFALSRVNLAMGREGGGSGRQTGSSFKPFVLAEAFEQGYAPSNVIVAPEEYVPETATDPEPVRNFDGQGHGRMTLAEATMKSVNTAYVALTDELGPNEVASTAESLGVSGLPAQVGSSIGIGAYESSPLDMASAYAGFANGGHRVDPTPIVRVLDRGGEEIDVGDSGGVGERVLEEDTTHLVSDVLRQVVERGTATRADFGRPAAAKTGTSDNYENAWLVGYTPQLAAAVWVGHPEGNVSMREVAGLSRVTGGSLPAKMWSEVMEAAHDGLEVVDFPTPPQRAPKDVEHDLAGVVPSMNRSFDEAVSTSTSSTSSTATSSSSTSTSIPPSTTTTRPATTTSSTTLLSPTTTTTSSTTTTTTTPPADSEEPDASGDG